jgi:thiol peroxidase
MTSTKLGGNPIGLTGDFPCPGDEAANFTAVKQDLSEVSLGDFKGKRVILNIFPSIDTDVCATSVRTFNQKAANLDNTEVLCLSFDLPFALGRFCGAEGIENVTTASLFRNPDAAKAYGVLIQDGPLAGLAARAVVVVDDAGQVIHAQLSPEIKEEVDYEAALSALS